MNELDIVQRLATIEEHIRAANGTEKRIEDKVDSLGAQVNDLGKELANWKGRMAILLMIASALIASGVSLLMSLFHAQ